jgi:hypothetical protein
MREFNQIIKERAPLIKKSIISPRLGSIEKESEDKSDEPTQNEV